jgi:hypothetical protein
VGNRVVAHEGQTAYDGVPTEAMPVGDIIKEVGLYQGGSGVVRIYNLFQKFNRHPGDFYDGDYYAQDRIYSIPRNREDLIDDLAALSLSHKVVGVEHRECGIGLLVMESTDGTTNIDADVIDAVVGSFKRKSGAFKKKAKRRKR